MGDFDPACQFVLNRPARQPGLSVRAYHRILNASRTLADLERTNSINSAHLLVVTIKGNLPRAPGAHNNA